MSFCPHNSLLEDHCLILRKPWHWVAFCKALRPVCVRFGCNTRRQVKKEKKEGGEGELRRPQSALAILAARDVRFDPMNVDSFGDGGLFEIGDGAIGVDIADFERPGCSRLELCWVGS
jgi:hypothetical protein